MGVQSLLNDSRTPFIKAFTYKGKHGEESTHLGRCLHWLHDLIPALINIIQLPAKFD